MWGGGGQGQTSVAEESRGSETVPHSDVGGRDVRGHGALLSHLEEAAGGIQGCLVRYHLLEGG